MDSPLDEVSFTKMKNDSIIHFPCGDIVFHGVPTADGSKTFWEASGWGSLFGIFGGAAKRKKQQHNQWMWVVEKKSEGTTTSIEAWNLEKLMSAVNLNTSTTDKLIKRL